LDLARSQRQFVSLASLMLHRWRADRENELTDWFEATYLIEPFNRWSVTSSGIPGVSPNQNPIESFHRQSKRESSSGKRVKTTHLVIYLKINVHFQVRFPLEPSYPLVFLIN
jgi:hypothetical protein